MKILSDKVLYDFLCVSQNKKKMCGVNNGFLLRSGSVLCAGASLGATCDVDVVFQTRCVTSICCLFQESFWLKITVWLLLLLYVGKVWFRNWLEEKSDIQTWVMLIVILHREYKISLYKESVIVIGFFLKFVFSAINSCLSRHYTLHRSFLQRVQCRFMSIKEYLGRIRVRLLGG